MPGSVALDFDSASLYAPFQLFQSFDAMALFSGASAAVGVYEEPGAGGHPRPDVLFAYLTRGFPFADAAWLSMPAKPLFAYAIGDPLMRPFRAGRARDTSILEPEISVSRKGNALAVKVKATGKDEVLRVNAVLCASRDDALLRPCTYREGWFARDRSLTVDATDAGKPWLGVVATDPAGNTVRVWKEVKR
jgi:hypothetical protein